MKVAEKGSKIVRGKREIKQVIHKSQMEGEINKTSDSQESDGGRDQQVKVMRRNSVQSEEYVILKLKEEEAGFSSLN